MCSWLDKESCTLSEVCAIWCKSLVLVSVDVVLGAVLHFARYMRCLHFGCVVLRIVFSVLRKRALLKLKKTVMKSNLGDART